MPDPYRVIVTGSRYYSDPDQLHQALTAVSLEQLERPLIVIHGACVTGADALAHIWASNHAHAEVTAEPMRASWGRWGRRAGPLRNQRMVEAGADLVLAFYMPNLPCRGTHDCVARARRAGIPVREYTAHQEVLHG